MLHELARNIKVVNEVDVIVVGGGMSGCSAAVAGARNGARTLLLERHGFLGGTATAAMLGSFCGLYTCAPDSSGEQLIYGQAQELIERLSKEDGGRRIAHRYHYEHSVLMRELDRWLLEAGVELYFHTYMVKAVLDGKRVTGVILENKAGRTAILGRVMIDASGDGDVAASAGAAYELGDSSGRLQAPTYVFYVGGVDVERAMSITEVVLKARQLEAINSGEFLFKRISGSYSPALKPGVVHVNMTRTPDVNGINPEQLTAGHISGREQIEQYFNFLRKYIPGFEASYIDSIAYELGIRETRRILGEYVLTREDVLGARKFEDAVCRSSWPVEDHTIGLDTVRLHLQGDDYYHVPYRVLIPRDIDNLLVTGRCISVTHDAHASIRVMGPGIALGQTAGTAAALSISLDMSPRTIPVKLLQERLVEAGGLI